MSTPTEFYEGAKTDMFQGGGIQACAPLGVLQRGRMNGSFGIWRNELDQFTGELMTLEECIEKGVDEAYNDAITRMQAFATGNLGPVLKAVSDDWIAEGGNLTDKIPTKLYFSYGVKDITITYPDFPDDPTVFLKGQCSVFFGCNGDLYDTMSGYGLTRAEVDDLWVSGSFDTDTTKSPGFGGLGAELLCVLPDDQKICNPDPVTGVRPSVCTPYSQQSNFTLDNNLADRCRLSRLLNYDTVEQDSIKNSICSALTTQSLAECDCINRGSDPLYQELESGAFSGIDGVCWWNSCKVQPEINATLHHLLESDKQDLENCTGEYCSAYFEDTTFNEIKAERIDDKLYCTESEWQELRERPPTGGNGDGGNTGGTDGGNTGGTDGGNTDTDNKEDGVNSNLIYIVIGVLSILFVILVIFIFRRLRRT